MPHAPLSAPASRRQILGGIAAVSTLALASACGATPVAQGNFPVRFSDAEWKKRLTPEQYYILRQAGTERPFTSPLLNEHRKGTFVCAADGNALFASATKFDSGTGWPSFWKPLDRAVATTTDRSFGMNRTEVHCTRCGGHLGHVFDDGPKPTGLRYCMNGDAMKFRPG
ncbi:peptide-methionine (R)-S-oxide reductase MsrB [Novosphingobium olei]|uniref:peptide-methionine (R)-S-oxide reductase n=1 Tax=Novosphingobium olei TaxID=2728851 RepID=A0A7Y0BRQ6_9SPHN|nr:peptide-methionine (R)-S-oxide reductase MsrB [Novosphingobium olei]NML95309.1 peptide-methionine (R)-S-oxide reductase MsrB [Novosphingobium olei]